MKGFPGELCGEASACRQAATRAYAALREAGVRDPRAFEAAVTVFRYHHPEAGSRQARHIVADWLAPEA